MLLSNQIGNRLRQARNNSQIGSVLALIEHHLSKLVQLHHLLFFSLGFIFAILGNSSAHAAALANHAAGSASAGATKWATTVNGSSCATSSCHGAVVPGASPTTGGTFGYSAGAFLVYANSPADLASGATNIGGPGGMPADNITYANTHQDDLSAYLASFVTPVLTAIADFTLGSGAAYPATASRQISPATGDDYIVDSTTFSATGLPTGVTINSSTGVVSGNVPNNLTTPQTYTITLRATNSAASPTTGTTSFDLTVRAIQTITFAAPSLSQGGSATLSATGGGSGQPVVFSIDPSSSAVCSVSGTNGQDITVTGTNGQNCRILANQAASGNYEAATQVTRNVTVGPGVQTIAFGTAPTVTFGGTGTVTATGGGSGNPVVFTSLTPSDCSTSGTNGSTITGLLAGTNNCTIAANQAAGGGFNAATQVTQDISIGMQAQVITFGTAPTIVEAGTGVVSATGGGSGNAVTLTSLTLPVCTISGNTVTSITIGTCTIAANQLGNANYSAATQATQSITIGSAPPTVSGASFQVTLNTPTVLDLSPFTTGSSITGVRVTTAPSHGTVTVSGERVTYTPVTDFFGTDTFAYTAFGTLGESAPATVTVNVVGRPDPRRNANVMGLLTSQNESAKRMSRAQVTNFQQRTEALHGRRGSSAKAGTLAGFERQLTPELSPAAKISAISKQLAEPDLAEHKQAADKNAIPVMLAYQDAPAPQNNGADANAQKLAALGNTLLSVLSTKTINLAGLSTTIGGESASAPDAVEIWMMGNIRFGVRENDDGGVLSSYRTSGITIGADKRFSDSLVIGAGLGYAREKTDISDDGSESVAKGVSAAVYASYMPTDNIFVDGLLGYGVVDFDSDRFVSAANDFARLNRKGDQIFAAITTGYEYRNSGLLFSPYGRLNVEYNRLDSGTESGAGLNALHYSEQKSRTAQLSLGFRAEATHKIDGGLAIPHARIEFQGNLDRNGSSNIRYADQLNGTGFNLTSTNNSSRGILLGFGNDFILDNGLKLAFEYQTLRGEGDDNSQSINFRIAKELGGPENQQQQIASSDIAMTRLGIRLDAGYTYDDNVSRSELARDQEKDSIYSIRLSKGINIPLAANTRIALNGFAAGERFDRFRGLENISAGLQGEFQYRPSGEYTSPIFGVFAKAAIEEFESSMRDGVRYSAGISLRKPWTDRINLFGALSYNLRESKSEVFDTEDVSARLNMDYMITKKSTLYASGEYRYGDTLSAGSPSLKNADTADVLESDDVFTKNQLTQYRFKGHSYLTTIGYNFPLGAMDSIDFSWRRVQSSPENEPSYLNGTTRYIVNQYSIVYLVRF